MLQDCICERGKLVEPPSGSTFTSTGPNLCFDPILEVRVGFPSAEARESN